MNEKIPQCLRPDPIKMLPIELKPHRLLNDGEEFDAIEGLAHYLAVQCITCILDVVKLSKPLNEPEYSSIIWLRSDGRIELVREKYYRNRSCEDLLTNSLYIEAFRSRNDVLPVSPFHRCIDDSKGDWLSHKKSRRIWVRSKWDNARSIATNDAYASAISRISLERVRIEALRGEEVVRLVKRCRYRESLKKRILAWLIAGKYPACIERLSVFALKRESEQETIIRAFGKERIHIVLARKTRQALANEVLG